MNPVIYAQQRYTCKSYDANRKIDAQTLDDLLQMLWLSPSSINIQPWRFFVTDNAQTKAKIIKSMIDGDEHNVAKINNCSHVIIFCTRTNIDEDHLMRVLQAEKDSGRFASEDIMKARLMLCQHYISQLTADADTLFHWAENQTFIALGQLLLSAQLLGVDATPIGGYNKQLLNKEFEFDKQNLQSSVLVALGYASNNDNNKTLAKARLDKAEIFEFI